jgi:HAD superfamily hydrolase (TIGR01509 family)
MRIDPGIALIFDMDGVIVDSNPLHVEAWRIYNQRHGIDSADLERRMYGRRNDEIVRDFFGPDLAADLVVEHGAAKERLYREMMAPRLAASLVPGVTHFLQRLNGTRVGLATNAEPANVDFILDTVEAGGAPLRKRFAVIVDGHQVSRPKPDPEIYLRTAALLGAEARNCVIFEDSHGGVEAARLAGARVVAVRTTHREFKNIGLAVDHFLDPELEKWLESQKPL